jgi:predicted nucleic acid-binding protein
LKFVLDSSSIINLFNAGFLALLCQLKDHEFFVPPMVVGECHGECAVELVTLSEQGCVTFLDDDVVDADQYLTLLETHRLGAGETECMAVATSDDFGVCCDDRKAREATAILIGEDRVIGTMGLLKRAVEQAITTCANALALFTMMKEAGGFLPDANHEYFCPGG